GNARLGVRWCGCGDLAGRLGLARLGVARASLPAPSSPPAHPRRSHVRGSVMATVYVLACVHEAYDPQAGTCSQEIWIPQASVVPVLTIEDAQQIGMAIALLLAVAFTLR